MFRVAKRRGHLLGSSGNPVGAGHGRRKFPRAARTKMPAKSCRHEHKNWQGEIIRAYQCKLAIERRVCVSFMWTYKDINFMVLFNSFLKVFFQRIRAISLKFSATCYLYRKRSVLIYIYLFKFIDEKENLYFYLCNFSLAFVYYSCTLFI